MINRDLLALNHQYVLFSQSGGMLSGNKKPTELIVVDFFFFFLRRKELKWPNNKLDLITVAWTAVQWMKKLSDHCYFVSITAVIEEN